MEGVETPEPALSPRELVILAEDYDAMVAWYQEVLGFRALRKFANAYRYTHLKTDTGISIGIEPASEVGVKSRDRSANTVILQVAVPDVKALLERIQAAGGTASFGPSFDEGGQFWFGGFSDLEGPQFGWSTGTAPRRCGTSGRTRACCLM